METSDFLKNAIECKKNNKLKQAFFHLNCSVLSGEFTLDYTEFKKKIESSEGLFEFAENDSFHEVEVYEANKSSSLCLDAGLVSPSVTPEEAAETEDTENKKTNEIPSGFDSGASLTSPRESSTHETGDAEINDSHLENKEYDDYILIPNKPELSTHPNNSEKYEKNFDNAIKFYKELAENISENIRVYLNPTETFGALTKPKRLKLKVLLEKLFHEDDEDFDSEEAGYFLFLLNLSLAELDEYLECNTECLNDLESLQDYLKEVSLLEKWTTPIVKILRQKCSFLAFKINYRRNRTELDANLEESSPFQEFHKESTAHYNQSTEDNGCSAYINSAKDLEIENITSIKEVHQMNKFLKRTTLLKISEKINVMEELQTKVLTFTCNDKDNFHEVALKSVKNLLRNTKLFFILEQERENNYQELLGDKFHKITLDFLNNTFIRKMNDQLNSDAKDYRKYEYVLEFFNELFKQFQDDPKRILNYDAPDLDLSKLNFYFDKVRENIEILMEYYKDLISSLEKSKIHLNMFEQKPIYLEWNDCIKEHSFKLNPTEKEGETTDEQENFKLDLFLDSSYILPVDFQRVDDLIKESRLTLKIRQQLISGRLSVLFDLEAAKSKLQAVESKLNANDFKVVQIVAMFVSIATFVLINVKIFDDKTGIESFAIMVGLAGVFVLFNGFFNWLVISQNQIEPDKKIIETNRWVFGTSGILIMLSMILMIFFGGTSINLLMKNQIDSSVDSLVKNNTNDIKKGFQKELLNTLEETVKYSPSELKKKLDSLNSMKNN